MIEEITDEEFALIQVFTNPVMFREFINEGREGWTQLEDHERAWSTCEASYLSMCCGRGVHKTETMIEMLYYWMVNEIFIPGDPGLLVYYPNKSQKDFIWARIRSACETHWLISKYTNHNKINEQIGRIEFVNGFTLIMKIAGSENREANVISVHGPKIWVDEAQDFPWKAWLSLANVLKRDIPWHTLWVSGVPNGDRQNNVLFRCDQEDPDYIKFNVSQTQMSWWTPELEKIRRREYNALQDDTEDYKHFVLGQHGVPVLAIFDRMRFLREDYEVHKIYLNQARYDSTKRSNVGGGYSYHINEAVDCPELPAFPRINGGEKIFIGLGYDVGYSPDPAVFFIMYRDPITGVWRNLVRYILERVEYLLQAETLAWLDQVYNFDFIGMDMTGVGKPQLQTLTSEVADPLYQARKFSERIYGVDFAGSITVAVQEEKDKLVEKKDNVKRVAVETISRWVHEHRFAFSRTDEDLMAELERTKYSRTVSGETVYRTSNDHQFAAFMCAVMAYEKKFGIPLTLPKYEIRPKLMPARWLMPQGV
jgi:hypothetical protein